MAAGAASPQPLTDGLPQERWRPRPVLPLGVFSCGPAILKAYAILADTARPLTSTPVESARTVVEAAAPALRATPHRGLGFVLIDRGEEAVWLLLHWWMERGVCAQLVWKGTLEGLPAFEPIDRPRMACVWELALIDHERRAYVRSMMAASADADAYLNDLYRQDFC
jgi:hypothetical protein